MVDSMAHRCLLQAALVCCMDNSAHYLLFTWASLWLWHGMLIRSMSESELSMQARAMGADAALLIAAVLPNNDLAYLLKSAAKLRLQILIEVHTVAGAPPLVLLLHCGRPQDLQILIEVPLVTGVLALCCPPVLCRDSVSPAGHDELRLRSTSSCGVWCFTAFYDSAVGVVKSRMVSVQRNCPACNSAQRKIIR